jgi:hypothetical protein
MSNHAVRVRAGQSRASLYDEITDKIIVELEAGRIPWVQPWGTAAAKAPLALPKNASTARQYSGVNILILWGAVIEHGFTGQIWLTFRQALSLGGHVRKGERGTVLSFAVIADYFPREFAARANGALNLLHFGFAFVTQYGIGFVVGQWPSQDGHYPVAAFKPHSVSVLRFKRLHWCGLQCRGSKRSQKTSAAHSLKLPRSAIARPVSATCRSTGLSSRGVKVSSGKQTRPRPAGALPRRSESFVSSIR